MMNQKTAIAHEYTLNEEDFIISKTDNTGLITYANRAFMQISQYPASKLLGHPQNIVRHSDMPKGVFKLLWRTIQQRQEFFGFIKNICANGDFYWVFANITTDDDIAGNAQGYHSIRRKAPDSAIETIIPIYQEMLSIEKQNSATGADDSLEYLESWVTSQGLSYRNLMLKLYKNG
ncbi:MAG: aerotaxis receptor Aer [Piscirickettsiaceae bacterium]|nr:MAG: aerotaxis receptor Aer [Piscirickettsiaceae bacterium]